MNASRFAASGVAVLSLLALAHPARGDDSPTTATLWPAGTPGSRGDNPDLDVPSITVYRPEAARASGSSVVVCPGGGYGHLAMDHEGRQVAVWLNEIGVTAVVLKYRLGPRYRHPAMLDDVSRAIRTVRFRAKEWGLDPDRIAVMGFSAGGHLASTVATHFDAGNPDSDDPIERVSSRPDRLILAYPVVALATTHGHAGSRRNLLGDSPPAELVESLSNERQVTAETPPTFLVHTTEDKAVPPENSLLFAMALRKHGVSVELHLFEKGRHGLGLGGGDPAFSEWPKLCENWLRNQGFLGE